MDARGFTLVLKKSVKRTSAPGWSLLAELRWMVLDPLY